MSNSTALKTARKPLPYRAEETRRERPAPFGSVLASCVHVPSDFRVLECSPITLDTERNEGLLQD